MKLYSENDNYKLYLGNMLDMLEVIEKESIDSIVTDPPYELNFMNKGWDNSGIAFQKETWQKCYEVLKPGGYLLAFGGSRTFHRIACAIEDAGFEIRDTIMWLYGSGFPKSMDISKQIDKKGGVKLGWFAEFLGNLLKEKNMTITELAEKGKFYGNVNHGGSVCHWVSGKNTPSPSQFNKLCEILDLPFNTIDEVKRKIIGTKKSGGASAWINGMNNKENEEQKYTGFSEWEITAPSTELAKQWDGWGTALKPSFEPIIVARKPFKGSCVDNVIKYGVGGINIDECRVPFINDKDNTLRPTGNKQYFGLSSNINMIGGEKDKGRFPANTILTYDETDFDEVCGGFPNTKGQAHIRNNTIGKYDFFTEKNGKTYNANIETGYTDSGFASRYFYCAKASKKDRDEGLELFNQEKVNDGRQTPIDNAFQRGETLRKNTHPTVKPIDLMEYLVRLVTPNGGTVLDPFNGSGSTGKAVMYENKERNKNYKYIGIELTEEYLPISKARIEYVCNLKEEKDMQTNIFDFIKK